MYQNKYFFILLILIIQCVGCSFVQNKGFFRSSRSCKVNRAAFDVGSEATKMKVYRYNKCKNKIIKQIDNENGQVCEGSKKVSYKKDLENSDDIKEITIRKGFKALVELREQAHKCGAKEFLGVATSAFRQAQNGPEVVRHLSKAKVLVSVISQEEEAVIGFKGALGKLNSHPQKICVWDIGGSSMQIICKIKKGRIQMYLSQLGAIPFKNLIVQSKGEDIKHTHTPNPITQSGYVQAIAITQGESKKIFEKLEGIIGSSKILGIGGVHYYAVSKELNKKIYTADDIRFAVLNKLNKTDEQLDGGDYVDTSVSNLILVEGLMRHLNISSVQALKVNLTEGLVVSQKYWE